MRLTPESELAGRVARFQEMLREHDLDGAVVVQNADLFYFAGTIQRSHLIIPASGQPLLAVTKSFERAAAESALPVVLPMANPRQLPSLMAAHGLARRGRWGFELDVLPAAQYLRYQKLFAPAEIIDISPLIRLTRMVKSPYELDIIRDAAARHQEIFALLPSVIREGMSETELAGIIECEMRRRGHCGRQRLRAFNSELGHSFLSSGANLAVGSYFDGAVGGAGTCPASAQGAGFKLLARDEPILVDPAFVFDGYGVDQTRVFCMGRLPRRLEAAYDVSLAIQEDLIAAARPGAICADLWRAALALAEKNGLADHFMGYGHRVSFVGHGIGIEIDELPVIAPGFDTPLAPGMTICFEPKFVFPEGAVGIENTFLVTAHGLERLTVFDEGVIYI